MKPQQQTPPTSTEYVVEDSRFEFVKKAMANSTCESVAEDVFKQIEQSYSLLAKALQDIKNEGHKLLSLYANSDHYTEADMYKLFRTGVGNWVELSEKVLQQAGLTE